MQPTTFSDWVLDISSKIPIRDDPFDLQVKMGYCLNPQKIWCQLIQIFDEKEIKNQVAKQLGITPYHVKLNQFKIAILQIINSKIASLTKEESKRPIIYRFTDLNLFKDQERPVIKITLREAWNKNYLSLSQVEELAPFGNIEFIFEPMILSVFSSSQHKISLWEYYHGEEKGGQIVGFYSYPTQKIMEPLEKPIFICQKPISSQFEEIGLSHEIINLFGQLDDKSLDINGNIGWVEGKVKEFHAGRILKNPVLSEINWVGDFSLMGYSLVQPSQIKKFPRIKFLEFSLDLFSRADF